MSWDLSFISEIDFTKHVRDTIEKYGNKLESYDLIKFNKNLIDPIKLIFDKTVYHVTWSEIIGNEIFRQRDKSNNNDIGYFHQRIFQYVKNCKVPDNGKEGGWDIIFAKPDGIVLPDGDVVHTVFVEMKNKHNTMNSSSAEKTYTKMQQQILKDDDCACFLVEVIAKNSQNIKWETTINKEKKSHKRIRRVSIDQFYALVTGEKDAFYKMCMVLPETIEKVVHENKNDLNVPHDKVVNQLKSVSQKIDSVDEKLAMVLSVYLLGFPTYNAFSEVAEDLFDDKEFGDTSNILKKIYEYSNSI